MNRQQRRMIAKQKEVEHKYMQQIIDHAERIDEHQIKLGLVSMALALNKLYGWKEKGIENVITEYVNQITRINDGETLQDLMTDLERKTGVRIKVE